MKILLIRHGETEGNYKGLYQGRSEYGLNEEGKKQAIKLGELLKDYNISKVYCSPQKRCIETLELMNKKFRDIVFSEELREIDFGKWEGLNYKEIEKLFPGEWKNFIADYSSFTFPKGDSFKDFYYRCNSFLDKLKNEKDNEVILIVTHGGVIRALFSGILSLGLKGFYIVNPMQGAYSEINIFGSEVEIKYVNKDN
ncbi:alpha-ribazole phosphatase [Clostridium sp. 'White wine YQ']|uniref:alpha-ribazole phosphatase n=1 Tax=Clostridium sp. 'White wine YQ' TaxID=3027474 RepID=UPI0023673236|nr:alpha-ribazole phosphatase [Clostridium sp. 'White wine YQ']MDD7794988.1 alpha-ribazole phosphatase [Clostridium sp. 'White wine YQ']